jgi:hypothetical protein
MKSFRRFVTEEPFRRRRALTNRPGEPFATDEMGRPDPNPRIQRESVEYCLKYGLAHPNHSLYVEVDQERAGRIADAYDALPMDDGMNANVAASYEALAHETELQWQWAVDHGMTFEPWTGKGEAYGSTDDYADVFTPDADIYHRHLYFFTGGEPNPFMARISKLTGLPVNDMFRAVHDYYGHACIGSDFGPVGEENAWVSHMQMFSPAAQAALTTETRGQNSWVNFGRQNYDDKGNYLYIAPKDRPYAVQKTAIFQGTDAWIVKLPDEVTARSVARFDTFATEDVRPAPAMCEWGSCTAKAEAFVRFRNAIGMPTAEGYWYCGHHADTVSQNCPRGDFIEVDQRQIDEDVRMAVASSNLQSFRYDETTNTLTIRFRSGGVYEYADVPPDIVDEMRWSESRGRYFWNYIRTRYSYTMVSPPRPGFGHAKNTAASSVHQRTRLHTPKRVHRLPPLT